MYALPHHSAPRTLDGTERYTTSAGDCHSLHLGCSIASLRRVLVFVDEDVVLSSVAEGPRLVIARSIVVEVWNLISERYICRRVVCAAG